MAKLITITQAYNSLNNLKTKESITEWNKEGDEYPNEDLFVDINCF